MKKLYVILLALPVLYYISTAEGKQTLLQQTIESNNTAFEECFRLATSENIWRGTSWSVDTERFKQGKDCWQSQRKLTPDDLFLTGVNKVAFP